MKPKYNSRPSALCTVIFAGLIASSVSLQAADGSWTGTTSGAWLTGTNWTSSIIPGSTSLTTNPDIATFNVAANPTIGIDMSATSGVYYLGAIDNTNATARIFNNSSTTTPGVLTLNGATVNAVANTILRNSTNQLLTLTNGTVSGTMGLALGNATENIIQITSSGGVTIGGILSGTNRPLTLQGGGSGTLTLSGVNTFAGAITLKSGVLAAALDSALGNAANGITLEGSASLSLGTVSYARNLTLNNSATATFTANVSSTFTGNVTGTGGLAQSSGFGQQSVFNGTANAFNGRIAIGGSGTTGQAYRMSFKSLTDSATANGNVRFSASSVTHSNGSVFEYTGTTALNLANRKIEITSTGSTPTNGHQIRSYGTSSGTLTIGTDLLITAPYSQRITLDSNSAASSGFFNGKIGDTSTPPAANTTVLAATFSTTPTSTITLASIDGVALGASITGTGIASGTTITAINPATRVVTLSAPTNGTAGALNQVMTVAGLINTTSISKVGSGNWTLGGANTFRGTTTISNGKIIMTNPLALQNSAYVTTGSTGAIGLDVTNGLSSGKLTLGGIAGAVNLATAITGYTGVQDLTLNPQGTQTNTYTGIIANGAAGMTLTKTGTGTQTLNGVISLSGSSTSVSVTNGTLTLGNSSNSYTGITAIGTGTNRVVIVTANGTLGATGAGNETTIAGTPGVTGPRLGFSGGINYTAMEKVIGTGSGDNRGFIQSVSGNNTFAGNIELSANGNSRIGTQNGAQLTLTGTITQGSGITTANILFRCGDTNGDFVTLSNTGNSFGGDSAVYTALATAGQYAGLRLGVDNAHPVNLTVQNFSSSSGSSTALDLNGKNQALNGLASGGAGTLKIINLDTVTASTLTLNPASNKDSGTNITVLGGSPGGTPLGVINVEKVGGSTQTLSGVNTYTGTTTVVGGTLAISGGGSIADTPRIQINSSTALSITALTGTTFTLGTAQTLAGDGTVLATGKTVNVAGTLAPGASPGSMTQDGGTMQLAVGGDYNWQILDATAVAGTGYDTTRLINGAALDLSLLSDGNTFNINLWSLSSTGPDVNGDANFNNALTQSWTLFSTGTAISSFSTDKFTINAGAFNGTSGFTNALGGGAFSVGLADSNTDIVLTFTAVPEPRAAILGAIGLLALLRRRR